MGIFITFVQLCIGSTGMYTTGSYLCLLQKRDAERINNPPKVSTTNPTAITTLSDCTGSSVAIKKYMQSNLKWMNVTFLKALKDGVESGTLVKVRGSLGKL